MIVVGQAAIEQQALEYAATELYAPGDTLILLHVAAVLPPCTAVLHSAPQTVYSVPQDVDQQELHAKVCKAVRSRCVWLPWGVRGASPPWFLVWRAGGYCEPSVLSEACAPFYRMNTYIPAEC